MELLKFAIILSFMHIVAMALSQWQNNKLSKKMDETQAMVQAAMKKLNAGTTATKVKATTTVKKKPAVKKPTYKPEMG